MQTLEPNQLAQQSSFSKEDWLRGYRSQPQEFAYWIDQVEGQIPLELEGTLFRNGPGLLDIHGYPVRHPFDGDGMVNSIAFSQGRAFYRNRFVRTGGYVAEQQAGKPLYRGVFGTQKPGGVLANALDLRLKNIANTHVIYWGDKLLALWEAAAPHRLDPYTLETLGLDHLDGTLAEGDAFAAHPRFDPGDSSQGQPPRLVNFAIKPGLSTTITLYEFDLHGNLVQRQAHSVPGFAFIHDFAITPHYALLFQAPVAYNPLPYLLGLKGAAECITFKPEEPTKIWVIPRHGGAVQTLETAPCFVFHHGNAFEQEGQIVVDSICYRDFPSLEQEDYRTVDFEAVPEGQLWRFTLNLDHNMVTREPLIERCCEFPCLHPQRQGRPYRYLYLGAAHAPRGNAPLQALLKQDLVSGEEQVWSAAPQGFSGEPVFVPKPQGQAEDDGWLLLLLYNAARRCSDLAIFEAGDIQQGPLARLLLAHHVPYGLHGSFTECYFGPTEAGR
ncbi:Apocarotenoid-15,15'-oxygenase [Halomicronema hongdechloris C2206]|uniref:Apocarotenoid-15,15'-oxygenase n=1 Tax=Halomicronema hongdechloris C2206 TaxID=1641165 RepID=A0A1Z3HUF8_9CYAN|nr:carotenoid oxygenase family protein [Halomicronema hongdechloris]ASC73905.1 Apocarotenoid-15,15'-oxygenase [Halomicronema hongdechloris C2206]